MMSCENRAKRVLTIEIREKCGGEYDSPFFLSEVWWKTRSISAASEGISLLYIISLYVTIYGPCLMWNSHQSLGGIRCCFSHF